MGLKCFKMVCRQASQCSENVVNVMVVIGNVVICQLIIFRVVDILFKIIMFVIYLHYDGDFGLWNLLVQGMNRLCLTSFCNVQD